MTEEQKAWLEYGKAFGVMRNCHQNHNASRTLLQHSFDAGRELTPSQKRMLKGWKHSPLRGIVQEAWDARKKALAWNPRDGRSCSNCKHWHTSDELQSQECEYCGYMRSNWTPLEEEGGTR